MNNLIIEDAKVIFPNFSGREGRYNREGNRCFSVMVPDVNLAMQLKDDGWNIKERIINGEPTGEYYINGVNINYDYYIKPIITYISNGNELELTKEFMDTNIGSDIAAQLDGRGAERYDISIRPKPWDRSDGTVGIKGYVDEMRIIAKKSLFSERNFGGYNEDLVDDSEMPFR